MIDYAAPCTTSPKPAISPKRLTQVQRRWLVALGWPLAYGILVLTLHFPLVMTAFLVLSAIAGGVRPKAIRKSYIPILCETFRQGLTVFSVGFLVVLGLHALDWFDAKNGFYQVLFGGYWLGAGSAAALTGLGLIASAHEVLVNYWKVNPWIRWIVPFLAVIIAMVALVSVVLYLMALALPIFALALLIGYTDAEYDRELNDLDRYVRDFYYGSYEAYYESLD